MNSLLGFINLLVDFSPKFRLEEAADKYLANGAEQLPQDANEKGSAPRR
jgi:hypothetical protein